MWGPPLIDLSAGGAAAPQSPSSAYEDNRQMSGYEDQGDDHAAYEDGSHNDPDPFGTAWRAPITQQPRGTVGLRLGPEPEVVNAIEVNRARSRDITLREASREAVQAVHENGGAADEAFDEGAFVKGQHAKNEWMTHKICPLALLEWSHPRTLAMGLVLLANAGQAAKNMHSITCPCNFEM